MNNLIGRTVTVYDRYRFATPQQGIIIGVSDHDGAFQINLDNPHNKTLINKHNRGYWHPEQCRLGEEIITKVKPNPIICGRNTKVDFSPIERPTPKSDNILDGADDRRTDPKYNHDIGFIPFAYHLVPLKGLAKVAAVMRKGERKDRNGWERVPIEEHINHAISHLITYLEGRHAQHHLANAGCRVLMALDLDNKEVLPSPVCQPVKMEDWCEPDDDDSEISPLSESERPDWVKRAENGRAFEDEE